MKSEYIIIKKENDLIYKVKKVVCEYNEAKHMCSVGNPFKSTYENELRAIKIAKRLQKEIFVSEPEVDMLDFNSLM